MWQKLQVKSDRQNSNSHSFSHEMSLQDKLETINILRYAEG